MKKYKVSWVENLSEETQVHAETPEEAYKKFLDSEPRIKQCAVCVYWGFFGTETFEGHVRTAKEQGAATGESGEENRGATAPDTLEDEIGELESHKYSLRKNSAYSGLRGLLIFFTGLTATAFGILGILLLDENEGAGAALLLFGPLVAALQYFLASVYFDIADAGLNTSMSTQELLRMQSSKETASE